MFVGAKHDRSQYGIITNNLYAVMLRPLQKPDAPEAEPLDLGSKALPWNQLILLFFSPRRRTLFV